MKHHSGKFYAQTNMKIGGKWKRVLLHRFIMEVNDGVLVDHENRDGLDCTRENLRAATLGQNQHNSGPRKGKYKGVSWSKASSKWLAQIMSDNKHKYLGVHATPEAAAKAYDKAAKELHGEFAYQNFPEATDADDDELEQSHADAEKGYWQATDEAVRELAARELVLAGVEVYDDCEADLDWQTRV